MASPALLLPPGSKNGASASFLCAGGLGMSIWLDLEEETSSFVLKGLVMDGQETGVMHFGLGFEGTQREHTHRIKSHLLPSMLPLSSLGNGKPTVKSLCTQLGKMCFSSGNMFFQVGQCSRRCGVRQT